MKPILFLISILFSLRVIAGDENKTPSYEEVMKTYRELDSTFKKARLVTFDRTDVGIPLHLFIISSSEVFDPARLHKENKCILFINNGIHPGEPDGINASISLAKNLLNEKLPSNLLENTVVCIVPVFNIDGALNQSCCSRINQDGPEQYGFRANSKNLDLNRDFTKADSKNTMSLMEMIRQWDPDVFIDTHVSDGADYQYTMTLISSQHSKLNPAIGKFMKEKFTPLLFESMKVKGDEMTTYVNLKDDQEIPDSGIVAFQETPRFLSGYVSLGNAFSFISESHMLKPFSRRVKSTYNILLSILQTIHTEGKNIISARKEAAHSDSLMSTYHFNWKLDTARFEKINFNGYSAEYKKSNVTGNLRLFYDKTKPYSKKINFYDNYYPDDSVIIPDYFIVPQAYSNVISLMKINNISTYRLTSDSTLVADVTFIDSYETSKKPYDGHYLHYNIKTHSEKQSVKILKGDYLIATHQKNNRYILECLIPRAVDSYFAWNYFDSFLQQKEGFSDYVFEDKADSLLNTDPDLKSKFEKWKSENKNADSYSQLNFIYQHSPYFEKTFLRYPIFNIQK